MKYLIFGLSNMCMRIFFFCLITLFELFLRWRHVCLFRGSENKILIDLQHVNSSTSFKIHKTYVKNDKVENNSQTPPALIGALSQASVKTFFRIKFFLFRNLLFLLLDSGEKLQNVHYTKMKETRLQTTHTSIEAFRNININYSKYISNLMWIYSGLRKYSLPFIFL